MYFNEFSGFQGFEFHQKFKNGKLKSKMPKIIFYMILGINMLSANLDFIFPIQQINHLQLKYQTARQSHEYMLDS